MSRARWFWGVLAVGCYMSGSTGLAAQAYREAVVTYVDGRVERALVLVEAPGDIARGLTLRGPGRVDTLVRAEVVASAEVEGLGQLRRVRRDYRGFDGATVEAYRLALRIIRGPVNLYRLDLRTSEKTGIDEIDAYGTWTYFLEVDGTPYELPQAESSDAAGYRRRRGYVGRLAYHLRGCGALVRRLRQSPPAYRDADLAEVVNLYADCLGESAVREPRKRARPVFDGLLVSGGFYNVNDVERIGGRIPQVGLRASWRIGGLRAPVAVEMGVEYNALPLLPESTARQTAQIGIPLLLRFRPATTDALRPYAVVGVVGLVPSAVVEDFGWPLLLAAGGGVYVGRARVGARVAPVAVLGESRVVLNVGATVAYELFGPERLRARVPSLRW